MRRPKPDEVWPPRERDPNDAAVVAARLLAVGGRLETRLRSIARAHAADRYVMRLLLLFAEANRPLRIGNVADLLGVSHSTASRVASEAHAAGLVDKFDSPMDQRETVIRLTVPGRSAVTNCLDALRPDAADVLRCQNATNSHPHGTALLTMLGSPPHHSATSENHGWRAGVRAGAPAWA